MCSGAISFARKIGSGGDKMNYEKELQKQYDAISDANTKIAETKLKIKDEVTTTEAHVAYLTKLLAKY